MDKQHSIAILTAGLLAAAPAFAGHAGDYGAAYGQDDYDTAQVLSAEPLMRQVRITVPQRECYAETRYVLVNARNAGAASAAGPMLLGGLIGAVIGHQIDDRRSRNTGTVAGALIGTAIGHQVAQDSARRNAYGRGAEYRAVDAERCEVHTIERFEERIDGYRVTYRYNSRIYTTQMPRDPGATLRVRVNIAPVG
jgi:uncharacterized protein YcfJ